MKHRRTSRRTDQITQAVQLLEPRTLLSYSIEPNSAVVLNTSLGEVAIQLDSDTPITTANFLSYVTAGSYNGSIFHRATYNGDSNGDTFGIVQGGGFTDNNGTITTIPTNAPITNEATPEHPNSIGTIAMARTSGLDSATSQFFFNTTDNSTVFDNNSSDSSYNPYAVFGNVIRGLGIINTIDNLNTSNSVTASDGETLQPPETSTGSLVTINSATEEDTLTVTIGPNDAAGDKTVTFQDPTTKSNVTISLANADATLTFTGTSLVATPHGSNVLVTGDNVQLQEITSIDSTAKSALKINGKASNLGDINITGSINSISGSAANFSGDISVTGGVKSIKFKSSSAAGFINLDTNSVAAAPAATISIPTLSDINIQSDAAIAKLTAKSIEVDDGTSRVISASAIGSISVSGDLQAGIGTNGPILSVKAGDSTGFIAGSTIGSVTLKSLTNAYIYSTAAYNAKSLGIAKINIAGAITSDEIVSVGNIGSIKAASMTSTNIAAGYDSSSSNSPTDNFEFGLAANALLQSVTLKKPKSASAASFSDSEIDAYAIGSLNLGRIDTTNTAATNAVGVQAHTIRSLTAVNDENQSLKLSNITSQSQADAAVAKSQFALGNFILDMI